MRDLDAHSWVEVYFTGIGWVPFDPTPGVAPPDLQAGRGDFAATPRNAASEPSIRSQGAAAQAAPSADGWGRLPVVGGGGARRAARGVRRRHVVGQGGPLPVASRRGRRRRHRSTSCARRCRGWATAFRPGRRCRRWRAACRERPSRARPTTSPACGPGATEPSRGRRRRLPTGARCGASCGPAGACAAGWARLSRCPPAAPRPGGAAPRPDRVATWATRRCSSRSRPRRGSRPPTRSGSRWGPASPRRSCRRWASATTGEELRVYGALLLVGTELFNHPNVHYLSGFFGPIERALRDAGANISFAPADFRRFAPLLEEQSPRVMATAAAPPTGDGLVQPLAARRAARSASCCGPARDPDRLLVVEVSERFPPTFGLPPEHPHAHPRRPDRRPGRERRRAVPAPGPAADRRRPGDRRARATPSSPTARRSRPGSARSPRRSSGCSPRATAATTASTRRCSPPG